MRLWDVWLVGWRERADKSLSATPSAQGRTGIETVAVPRWSVRAGAVALAATPLPLLGNGRRATPPPTRPEQQSREPSLHPDPRENANRPMRGGPPVELTSALVIH